MIENGAGTLLYTLGGGAISPYPFLAPLNTAQAALRNWVHNLHDTLADQGVHAATVAVNAMIGDTAPEGYPAIAPDTLAPDTLAQTYWDLHTRRDRAEQVLPA